jgi:CubicO group peptidase (beta-lactamase class C family)
MKPFPTLALSMAILLVAISPSFATESIGPVDGIFADFDNDRSPGCALGVIRDGSLIYRRGYGMANLEHGIPNGPQSVFRIGSTSKQFTALAVALLDREGALSLDDPLSKHFPEFPDWADGITIRQLVHHSSGLRDYLTLAWLSGLTDDADYYTDQWVIDLLARQQELNFPPGEQYLYSNSGYLLLAHLVGRISGQSLRQFAAERIFRPLGMNQTHFHDDHNHIVPLRASGYAPKGDGFRISMTTLDIVGDGGVYTSIDDLLLWDRNFYDNRLGGGGPDLIRTMTTPGRLKDGESLDYAFGLTVSDYRGLEMISHGGAFVGYRAEMLRFPEQRFSVAVLCNRSDGAPTDKARRVASHFLADHMTAVTAPGGAEESPAIELSEEQLQEYEGYFWEAAEGFEAETRVIDGSLWAVHSPERRNELAPVAADTFVMQGVGADVVVTFHRKDGRVVKLTRTINGRPRGEFTPFTRRSVEAGALEAYSGVYFSNELQVWYRLYTDGDELLLRVAGLEPMPLTALFGETFENPDWGSFEFRRDAGGNVTGFKLQSGRVRNLEFKRRPESAG